MIYSVTEIQMWDKECGSLMPPQGFWLLSNWKSRKVKWGRERKKEKKNIIKIAHPSHDAYVRKDVSPSTWRLVWYWDAAFITAENTSIHTPVEQNAGETNNQAKTEHFKEMKSETFQDNYLIFLIFFCYLLLMLQLIFLPISTFYDLLCYRDLVLLLLCELLQNQS